MCKMPNNHPWLLSTKPYRPAQGHEGEDAGDSMSPTSSTSWSSMQPLQSGDATENVTRCCHIFKSKLQNNTQIMMPFLKEQNLKRFSLCTFICRYRERSRRINIKPFTTVNAGGWEGKNALNWIFLNACIPFETKMMFKHTKENQRLRNNDFTHYVCKNKLFPKQFLQVLHLCCFYKASTA